MKQAFAAIATMMAVATPVYADRDDTPEYVELTLKLDRNDLSRAIASLERHEYEVKETFGELERSDFIRERYDALMHYLDL